MSKKGLVLVYDPHNLLQFIWYYATYGKDKKWDAFCLPNADKGEYMSEYCKKSEIFENIIRDEKEFLNAPLVEQMKIFSKMLGFAVIGKQEDFCKKMLSQYVNLNEYDEFVVLADVGLISGMIIALSNHKKVVILEDGTGDYVIRSNKNIIKNITSFANWQGYLLSKMGYSNVGHVYPLKPTKNCIKFSSHPETMPYQAYEKHEKLFDFRNTDMLLYDEIINKVYEKITTYDFEEFDTVLFTCNLADFVKYTGELQKRTEDYVSIKSKNILLKKHPRDSMAYDFSNCVEVDQSIPAEVMLSKIKGKKIIFMQATSIMLYMNSNEYDSECLYYDNLYDESLRETTFRNYSTENELIDSLKKFKYEDIEIVHI